MKSLLCCAVIGTVFSVLSPSAFAQNPHFVGDASAVCSGPNLVTRFKISGLGAGQNVDVLADADAEVSCVNRGNNVPPGLTQEVTADGTFTASRSGQVTGTLTLTPEGGCPGRQRLVVTYRNVTLTATVDGDDIVETIPGVIICP